MLMGFDFFMKIGVVIEVEKGLIHICTWPRFDVQVILFNTINMVIELMVPMGQGKSFFIGTKRGTLTMKRKLWMGHVVCLNQNWCKKGGFSLKDELPKIFKQLIE
jgi:hypothetical protein